jgi:O-acetyl-ADP-ribose deacetylase (regulator of RNase III)
MPTTFVKGDILAETDAKKGKRGLAFAADCNGSMDVGLATALKKKWPALAEAFADHCKGGKMKPGDVFTWKKGYLYVFALGLVRDANKPTMSALDRAVKNLLAQATEAKVKSVLLPRVGAGKTALDWNRVKSVLEAAGTEASLDLVVFEQFIRKGGYKSDASGAEDAGA